ncbi:hypothetical protein ANCDUO_23766, partial [Ancylostoma duodenale]
MPWLNDIKGNSTIYNEFEWPDFNHITNVLLSWYKTLLLALIGVALALFLSYNMDDLQNELRHAKKTLKDLRDAIPPLPE